MRTTAPLLDVIQIARVSVSDVRAEPLREYAYMRALRVIFAGWRTEKRILVQKHWSTHALGRHLIAYVQLQVVKYPEPIFVRNRKNVCK
ncbi:MAG: hypothetical protein D6816_11640 [Bacteroidetes bacterium]|nr:MAG: hypothetical protein D6816_11640 [Bacteroidota bacterium]